MIILSLESPACNVIPIEGGKMLQFIDEPSGIVVNIPIPQEAATEISKALSGSKVDVVPATALKDLP